MTTPKKPGKPRLEELSEAISDDLPVNWEAELGNTPVLHYRFTRLQQLEAVARAHRAIAADFERASDPGSGLFQWGHFIVLERVGLGGFGEVYRARDIRLQREVALKLRRADAELEGSDSSFLREARNLALVRHSNVLVVHGVDVHDGRAGLWTDYVRGQTLAEHLSERGPLGANEVARIGATLCQALAAVHAAGLVHGDLKASNVMREDGGRILLMDFGSVNRVPLSASESSTLTFGTPLVLAPEVLRGGSPSVAADLYSLGVLLYQLGTGDYPVPARTWSELLARHDSGHKASLRGLLPSFNPALTNTIECALEREPRARFTSAEEMEQAIIAAAPSAFDSSEGKQSLASLLAELGRVPEELCRQIGREGARALARAHSSNRIVGKLVLDAVWLRRDGTVELASESISQEQSGLSEPDQLRALCSALFEIGTGRAWTHDLVPIDENEAQANLAAAFKTPFSSYFEHLLRSVLSGDPFAPSRSALEFLHVLTEGEASDWWKEHGPAIASVRRPFRRLRIPRDARLHGRDAELARLRAAFESSSRGDGQVVILEGEAGIGKTRLVDELIDSLVRDDRDLNFVFGSYPPGGAATAAGAFLSAYREHFGEERLEKTLKTHLEAAPLLVPAFAALLSGQSMGPDQTELTKDSLQTAFVHVTRSLANERDTIVLIDDLHFAPQEGLSLFAALASAVPGHRVLLIGAARPGLPASWMSGLVRQDHCTTLTLARLSKRDVVGLLTDALDSERLAETLAPELYSCSEGNPLFLFENLWALEEADVVRRDGEGRWILAESPRLPVPSTIAHLIQARFAGLEEEDKELLDVACCCGFEFDPTLVGEVVGLPPLAALRRFALIEGRHRLIRTSGRRYAFDHHQVREALYEGLFPQLREQYHALIATTLETREKARNRDPAQIEGMLAVTLCEQFFRGRRGEEGLRYLRRSLDHLGTLRPAATTELIHRALEEPGLVTGPDRVDLLSRLASNLYLLGKHDEEHAVLREILRLSDESAQPTLRAQARRMLGFFHSRSGHAEEARSHLEEAGSLARASGDTVEEAKVAQTLGGLALHQGRFTDALMIHGGALALARRAQHRVLEGQIVGSMGVACLGLHRLGEAQRYLEEGLAIARELRLKSSELIAVGNLGAVLMEAERFEEALPFLEEHLAGARQTGIRLGEAYANVNLGELFVSLGKLDKGLGCLESSLSISRECGYRAPEVECMDRIGAAFGILGRWESMLSHYERCLAMAQEINNRRVEGFALLGLAACAEASGDLTAAEALYERVERSWDVIGPTPERMRLLLRRGSLYRRMGRSADAVASLQEAASQGRELDSSRIELVALAHLALLEGSKVEELDRKLAVSEERLSLAERIEVYFLLWQASGRETHLSRAFSLLEHLRDHAPGSDRDSMVSRVPLYRDIDSAFDLSR